MVGVGEMLVGAAVKEAVAQASKLLGLALAPAGGQLRMMWTFREDVRKMKDTLESMQAVLMDAEKLSIRENAAKLWLKRLKKAAYDIADMFEDLDDDDDKPANKLLPRIKPLYKERGITGSWNSGPKIATEEKAILQSSKGSVDFWTIILEYMKNYGAKRGQRGPTRRPHGLVARPTPLGAPHARVGPWWLFSRCPLAIKSYLP